MKFSELRVKDILCVNRHVSKRKNFRAKNRNDHIVGIDLRGTAFHDFGYKSFTLTKGSVIFFNQRDDYNVHILEDFENNESLAIHFTTYEPIDDDSFCINTDSSGELLRILEKAEIKSRQFGLNDCETVSLLYKFCGELARLSEKPYHRKDGRIDTVRQYIDVHFCEKDCLSECVKLSGVSSRRFSDIFKASVNMTPNRYIVHRKVEYARELLRSGSLSVSEVAEICGFCDVYYFSRVFKAETGVPPKEWR